MKKTIFMLALVLPMMAMAQIVEVTSTKKLNTPTKDVRMAGISPDGSYVLITTGVQEGLTKIDVATQKVMAITDAQEAGYDAKISEDGKQILYRKMTLDETNQTYSSLIRQDISTREQSVIVKPTPILGAYAIKGNVVIAINKRQMKKQAIGGAQVATVDVPLVSTEDDGITLTRKGVTTTIAPNGLDELYIWASVSPDATKICYWLMSGGCWVANIDGSNPRKVSDDLHDAKWYNNNVLIGMEDKDDGHEFTASNIVLLALDGTRQVLTDGKEIAMYPYASANGKRIAFSTEEGNAYVLTVK